MSVNSSNTQIRNQKELCTDSKSFEGIIKLIPKFVAIATALTAISSLVIWILIPSLKEFSAGSMKCNTAIALLAGSLSLWFLQNDPQDSTKGRLNVGYGFALLTLLIGLATFAQYLFGIHFGIDELIVTDFHSAESSVFPGRMSPIASFCFMLMGIGLLLINIGHGKKPHPASFFLIPLFFISFLSILGYAYSERSLYQVGPFIRISWQTATCCLLLAIGILYSRPKDGPIHVLTSQGLGGMTARRLFPVVVIVPIIMGLAWLVARRTETVDRELGVSLFVIGIISIFLAVVGFISKRLDALETEGKKFSAREKTIKDRLMEVLDSAPLVVWALDKDGNFTVSEGKALTGLGLKSGEFVGRNHLEIYKDNPKVIEYAKRALKGESFIGEVEIQGRNFSTTYVPIFDHEGIANGLSAVSTDITERIQAEKDFETLANNLPLLCWMADETGSIYWYNQRWYDYSGTSFEDMQGWGWEKVHDQVELKRVSITWKRSIDSGTPWEDLFPLRNKAGQYRWFLSRAMPLRDSNGNITRWFGTNTDIDDQRNAEKRVADIIETMGDAFVALDKNWLVTQVNKNQENISKIKREDSFGKNFLDLFPGIRNPQSQYWIQYNRVFKERVPVEFEDYYEPLNLWTAVNAYPTNDGGIAIFFRDITIKKQAQSLVEQEKQKFEAIFVESSSAMALLKGPTFIFEKINPAYAQILPVHNLIGMAFTEAIPELNDQPFLKIMEKVYDTGEPFYGREALVRYARREVGKIEDVYFDFTYSRVLDGLGQPYGIYIHAIEVTEKVLARRRLEDLSVDLKESVRARDEFLSIASHELKTPLTSLKLQAQLFQRAVKKGDERVFEKERVTQIVEQTDKQASRLTRLVDDMLDVARIRSGKLNVEREEFNLCDVVNESIERLKSQFGTSGKAIPEMQGECEAVGCWDRLRLEQVITNLFTNAIRYGKGMPVKVHVEDLKEFVLLSVKDQGIGIAKEAQGKIFDRFERAINANEVSGLGLGLFITKQIIIAHGGRIWVESELGQGSTFFVELPKQATELSTETVNVL